MKRLAAFDKRLLRGSDVRILNESLMPSPWKHEGLTLRFSTSSG
jgi:hypothetical protein